MTAPASVTFAPTSNLNRRVELKKKYFEMDRAKELDHLFKDVIEDHQAGVLTDEHFEGCGLLVIGNSGSGKTREINSMLKRFGSQTEPLETGMERKYLQVSLVGEAKWKSLGLQIAEKLGYPLPASRTEHEIWRRARTQMQKQGHWILHIDECQHIFQTLGENEIKKVVNAFKDLMKDRDWPIVIVLSGVPKLLEIINVDPQFLNLLSPISLEPIVIANDIDELDTAFCSFAEVDDIDVSKLRSADIYARMAYGHEFMFGRVFRFMVEAFATLPQGQKTMTVEHLAQRYALKRGCLPGQNVFIQEDYMSCDVTRLMAPVGE